MSHMTCHDVTIGLCDFMVIAFDFRVCVKHCRVCVLSLDMIGHGMMWQRIRLHSHILHIHMGLTSILSHGFT